MEKDKKKRMIEIAQEMVKITTDCIKNPAMHGAISTTALIVKTLPEAVVARSIIAQLTEAVDFCKQDVEHRKLLSGFEVLIKNLNEIKATIE